VEELPSLSKNDHGIRCWKKEGDSRCVHETMGRVKCQGTESGSQWKKSSKLSSCLPHMTIALHLALFIQGLSHLVRF